MECRKAGIQAVMVTGDQPSTARAIAEAVGLVDNAAEARVMMGKEMKSAEELSKKEKRRLLKTTIFARFDPEQKLDPDPDLSGRGQDRRHDWRRRQRCTGAEEGRHRRGDGSARHRRSHARQPTWSCKMTASPALVTAVRQGRTIFGNIRKFVIYMLSGNTGEIFAVSLVALLNAPLPLLAAADSLHSTLSRTCFRRWRWR